MTKKVSHTKFKALLVAYKELDPEIYTELSNHFISTIKSPSDVISSLGISERSAIGLSYRIALYKRWFKDASLEKLNQGYHLGIIEIPASYGDETESFVKDFDKIFGDHVIIVSTEEF
ncbi:hypothetical protein [Alkalibacter saccharofermentans]|uniref:Uncharacterized protein n=1 Tax=Alkalibacter saccharofermentans DSM 14828 TaxID=1120975 RepID=A0A1M4YJX8_9FIRM|nr:hypothetical protein [Alkalibacter saccharofermentans]SHF06155.1 hypothetical protein SAMN02746064_01789 [Alkalibacter saccharofermentans DSM 14828]